MKKELLFAVSVFFLLASCKEKVLKQQHTAELKERVKDSSVVSPPRSTNTVKSLDSLYALPDTLFVRLKDYSADFRYNLRYATTNNFLKAKVYNCAECYVRVKTAKALIAANTQFLKQGYRIKFFDCYRPNSVQWQMWKIYPNPQYVANPAKGSIHNKGGAVDITLVTLEDKELPMGTDFDFFGKEAHHDYFKHTKEVLQNRKLLKEIMEQHGFWSIRTEWWHYNLSVASNYKVANFNWPCDSL